MSKGSNIAFELHQQLQTIVEDLESLASIMSRESSRHGCLMDSKIQGEEMAIIEARKNTLFRYAQLICRDHIAARAYDTKALELFGEFARLNFPSEIRL